MREADGQRRLYRVDPRLVHATLMNAWAPAVQARWILVACNEVAEDARQRHIYTMSASEGAEVAFVKEDEVARWLTEADEDDAGIVVFCSLGAVIRAVRAGLELTELNIGHVPRGPGRRELHPSVHLGSGDLEIIRQLEGRGVRVRVQPLPDDVPLAPNLPDSEAAPAPSNPEMRAITPVPRPPSRAPSPSSSPDRAEGEVEVVNERGLHLRAAHILAQAANEFRGEIQIGRPGAMVNAKSLLGITTLGAARGARLTVVVNGPDSEPALEQIRALFASGFSEGS